MTQIDWVRASFIGAIAGGVVWAAIIKLISFEFGGLAWQARSLIVAGVVNAVVLVVSWVLWRSAARKTLAAALWIVPFIGVAFFATVIVVGRSAELLGS